MDLSGMIASQNEGATPKTTRNKVVRLWNLAFVSEIDPGPAENFPHLQLKDRGVCVQGSVHPVLLHEVVPLLDRRVLLTDCWLGLGHTSLLSCHGAISFTEI
jgi:hypothetical protein